MIRITDHPNAFDPPAPETTSWTDIHPLVGDLAWLVVIRHARIPILGGHGGSYRATLAILVQTTVPQWVVSLTI